MNTHTRIGVLRGGPSSEFSVSLKTGASVLANLPKPFTPVDIFIDKEGTWHKDGKPIAPGDVHRHVDVLFNALHGEYGEDGKVQRVLTQIGLPFTGSRALSSALAMHKARAKEILKDAGIKMPRHKIIPLEYPEEKAVGDIFRVFSLPLVVKPISGGSSINVSVINLFPDLPDAIRAARSISPDVLIEECITGKEATVGVIEGFRGERLYALPPVEIRPPAESLLFDFDAKYSGSSEEICPGNFSKEEKRALADAACTAHKALGLSHYSRSDFIVSPRGIYFLEVNTLPGLTEESLFPKALDAVGSNLSEFLGHVTELSMPR